MRASVRLHSESHPNLCKVSSPAAKPHCGNQSREPKTTLKPVAARCNSVEQRGKTSWWVLQQAARRLSYGAHWQRRDVSAPPVSSSALILGSRLRVLACRTLSFELMSGRKFSPARRG